MRLYCEGCNDVHVFTVGEVERIAYALEAMERDARLMHAQGGEPYGVELNRSGYLEVEGSCFRSVLDLSSDGECYLEHVESCVEGRRVEQREAT